MTPGGQRLTLHLRMWAGASAWVAMHALCPVGAALAQVLPASTLLGWELLRNERPLPAAEAWILAGSQAAQRRNNVGLREAGFANVLAATAFEKAGDERAYARWAEAVRLYMEAGTGWEREREELSARWRKLDRDLNQAPAGVPPTLARDDQMLADLVTRVNLLNYRGPRTGLRNAREANQQASAITPQYFSGASRGEAEADNGLTQSRYGALAQPVPAAAGSLSIGPKGDATTAVSAPSIPASPAATPIAAPLDIPADSQGTATPPTPLLSRSQQIALNAAARSAAMAAAQVARAAPDMFAAAARPPLAPVITSPTSAPATTRTDAGEAVATEKLSAWQDREDQARAFTSSAKALASTGMPRQFVQTGKARVLTAAERSLAQQAWRYVVANRESTTGLVNGKDSYPVTSVADIAQTLAAYHAALGLQFIESEGFEADMRVLLTTLRELPLYQRELFNRDYDSRTGRMLDLTARRSELGSGWAADEIGRLLLWLRILAQGTPNLAAEVEAVVARLRLSRLVAGGTLHSVLNVNGREQVMKDLRLGRQQLTAAALALWGVVLPTMLQYEDALLRPADGMKLPADRREGGAISLDVFARGIVEIGGLDGCFEAAARAALEAQHAMAKKLGQPVMVADELLDRAPWFVYGALAANNPAWQVTGFDQQPYPALANFSLKAAHLWAAVDSAAPTLAARGLADSLERSERGLYGGRYTNGALNAALTLETNATVLLAAHYVQRGGRPMLRTDNPTEPHCAAMKSNSATPGEKAGTP